MPYQIGVTAANMMELDALYLPDPLWQPLSTFTPYSATRSRMDGLTVGTGRPTFSWQFNELTIAQVGTLLFYVSTAGVLQASKLVYVRTRILGPNMTDRVFQSYSATMIHPFEPDDMKYIENRRFRDAEFKFVNAIAI